MMKKTILGAALGATLIGLVACNQAPKTDAVSKGIAPKLYTDSLFAVMKADRTNYTKLVVQRLGPNGSGVVKPDEHWQDFENGTSLPAQMFRAGSEAVAELTDDFTYSLQSLWPIGKQNGPKTPMEKEGLEYILSLIHI